MKGSFAVNPKRHLQIPESLILADDVWTTGATMREAVNVLKRNGVKKVWCMTVAR
jgi:predicted amidophosphoribosyltransferase